MKNLNIEGSIDIPKISCDAIKGIIELKGKSIPENPMEEIYGPILTWLEEYTLNPKSNTVVDIKLDYFNTGSSKCLRDVFLILESLHKDSNEASVQINWYYEEDDEDMLKDGEDYRDKLDLPFELKKL